MENLNVRGIVRFVVFDDIILCVTTDTDNVFQFLGIFNFDYNAIAIILCKTYQENESYQISAIGQPYRFIFLDIQARIYQNEMRFKK